MVEYELVICMGRDYVPSLESAEEIVRLFEKHGLKKSGYPSKELCDALRGDSAIRRMVDTLSHDRTPNARYLCSHCGIMEVWISTGLRQDWDNVGYCCPGCHKEFPLDFTWLERPAFDQGITELKAMLVHEGVKDPDLWILLNVVDWSSDEVWVAAPELINRGSFEGRLAEILIDVYGVSKVEGEIREYLQFLEPERDVRGLKIDDVPDLEQIATDCLWERLPIRLPGWGHLMQRALITTHDLMYDPVEPNNKTHFMIWKEHFGRGSEADGLEDFIDYFGSKYKTLFVEIKEKTGSELLVSRLYV